MSKGVAGCVWVRGRACVGPAALWDRWRVRAAAAVESVCNEIQESATCLTRESCGREDEMTVEVCIEGLSGVVGWCKMLCVWTYDETQGGG